MKAKVLFGLLGGFGLALSQVASASQALGKNIDTIEIIGTQWAIVSVVSSTNITGRPACHFGGGYLKSYSFDATSSKGRAMLSLITSAHLSGKKVNINGGTTCSEVFPGNAPAQRNLETVQSVAITSL